MKVIRIVSCVLFVVLNLAATAVAAVHIDSSGYFISFDSTKIYYEIKGSGYPVVLVHGFIVDGESWKKTEVYSDLRSAGFAVITLDLRGNGRSGKPHTAEAYAGDAEAKDIMGLATALGLPAYDLVGYSRGSIITARLLVLDKRVHKAVIGGMGTDFTNPEWPRRKMFYRAMMGDTIPELEPVMRRIHDTGLDQLALAYMQKEQPSTPIKTLAEIRQPVLVICGDQDADREKARDLAAVFKHSQFAVVPGDHGSAAATKEFATTVNLFFNGGRSPSK